MPHGNKMFRIACPEIFSGVNADNTTKEQIEQSEDMRHFVVKSVLKLNKLSV
jgi:hypothetical protein